MKVIDNVFYMFVFEIKGHDGITELLEIFGGVINVGDHKLQQRFWRIKETQGY
jgi:hypothetical protein